MNRATSSLVPFGSDVGSTERDSRKEKERCRRVLLLLNELRAQRREIQQFDEVAVSDLLKGVKGARDLFTKVDDRELQGMVMVYNFLHPTPSWQPPLKEPTEEQQKLEALFEDVRTFIQLRMHPVQEQYLSTDALIRAEGAFDLRINLGEPKLKGVLAMFHRLHPEEVKLSAALPSFSFTILLHRARAEQRSVPFPRNLFAADQEEED